MDIFWAAFEPSGDLFAAETLAAIREIRPDLIHCGIGLSHLMNQQADIEPAEDRFRVVGTLKAIPALFAAELYAKQIAAKARGAKIAVLVDSWGLSIRVAQRIRQISPQTRLIKLIGPQVFIYRSGRALTLARAFDHLISVSTLDRAFYQTLPLRQTYVGHPAIGRVREGDPGAVHRKTNMPPHGVRLLLLPGSRAAEIARLTPVFVETVRRAHLAAPGLQVLWAPHPSMRRNLEMHPSYSGKWGTLAPADLSQADLFAWADVALAASGTVVTEAALHKLPVIVAYRVSAMEEWLYRQLGAKAAWVSLPNLVAGAEVVPEAIQKNCNPDRLAILAIELLTNRAARTVQINALRAPLKAMGAAGGIAPAKAAAAAVLQEFSER